MFIELIINKPSFKENSPGLYLAAGELCKVLRETPISQNLYLEIEKEATQLIEIITA